MLTVARFYIGFALLIFVVGLQPGSAGISQLRTSIAFAADSTPKTGETIAADELEAFAKAKQRVDEIAAFWSESISRSRSADVLRSVRENEIEIAIGSEGLGMARYRTIERIVKDDKRLLAVVARISEE